MTDIGSAVEGTKVSCVPGALREGTRVAVTLSDMREAYVTFRAMAGLAAG